MAFDVDANKNELQQQVSERVGETGKTFDSCQWNHL